MARFIRLCPCKNSARICIEPDLLKHMGLRQNDYVEVSRREGGILELTPMKGRNGWTRHEVEVSQSTQ